MAEEEKKEDGRPLVKQIFDQNEEILKNQKKIMKEIWYNRLALTVVLIISLYYIHLKTSRLGDVIGALIEIFMPS